MHNEHSFSSVQRFYGVDEARDVEPRKSTRRRMLIRRFYQDDRRRIMCVDGSWQGQKQCIQDDRGCWVVRFVTRFCRCRVKSNKGTAPPVLRASSVMYPPLWSIRRCLSFAGASSVCVISVHGSASSGVSWHGGALSCKRYGSRLNC